MRKLLLALICASFTLPANAVLGTSYNNSSTIAKKLKANAKFTLNKKGIVIRENWEAPAEMWSKAEAEKIMKVIAGQKSWISKKKDGGTLVYLFKNKKKVSLLMMGSKVVSATGITPEWNLNDLLEGKYVEKK